MAAKLKDLKSPGKNAASRVLTLEYRSIYLRVGLCELFLATRKIIKFFVEYLNRVQKFSCIYCPNLSNYEWLEKTTSISVSPNSNLNCINAGIKAGFVLRLAVQSKFEKSTNMT
jgi:hypothetical protein